MTAFNSVSFKEGMIIGLRAAAAMPDRESILREADRIADLIGFPRARAMDGEAEWQSWMIELELQSWKP